MVCYQIRVTGRVQGVFFRASTKNKALELQIKGWVRNETDGSVLIEAEGEPDQIAAFISWCHEGPQYSNVIDVLSSEIAPKEFESFEIVH